MGFIIDRSGSMAVIEAATIAGFNEFLEQQKRVPGEANVYAVRFDHEYDVFFHGPLKDAPALSRENFQPRGNTALHDAIGKTIDALGKTLRDTPEAERAERVVIVIMTDGLENASHEYNSDRLARMIQHQRDQYKWEFVYLGANQDACLVGEAMNIPRGSTISYSANYVGTCAAVGATTSNVAAYRQTGDVNALRYSQVQRDSAMADDDVDEFGNPRQPKGKTQ